MKDSEENDFKVLLVSEEAIFKVSDIGTKWKIATPPGAYVFDGSNAF